MALGFGFNKAKVLASAEKHVQQGKLNQAIAEYEKIMAKDARDLTVQNTIGDLYARIGQNEKAGEFFKRVGDTYAAEGFTVKAIAMYKKLTKLNPGNISTVQRLAEFYTQQGLYNDARQQYLQLADSYIKGNDLASAVRVFQKMLDMDPDNATLQQRLAELFIKMGKKDEARDIYLRAATSLYERGTVEQADDALNRMLALDPSNVEALLMRGKIALDAGDGTSAVRFLEKVPDIDTRFEGLNSLLRAYILCNEPEQAGVIARKLAQVHNNFAGVRIYADYLAASGKGADAVQVYDEFASRLVVGDSGELNFALQGLINQVKEDHVALEKLRGVFQKTGYVTNIPEVNELLAHACVKAGQLAKARDLYKELAELEPSNPQHQQNYRQVLARMGEDPTALISAADAEQALFIEEIDEVPLPPSLPEYPAVLQEKVANVLMDAELFESYNKPQQAVAPLEAVLKEAPLDVRLNQRLLSVYVRLGRTDDARQRCETLHGIYSEAGMEAEAKRYKDLATFFQESGETSALVGTPVSGDSPAFEPEHFDVPVAKTAEITAEAFQAATEPELPVFAVEAGEAHEIDLSSEWDAVQAHNLETFMPVPEPTGSAPFSKPADFETLAPEPDHTAADDLIEEIKFYLAQHMFDEARSALSRCERIAPSNPEVASLKHDLEVANAVSEVGESDSVATVELVDSEGPITVDQSTDEGTVSDFSFGDQLEDAVSQFSAQIESIPEIPVPAASVSIFEPLIEQPVIENRQEVPAPEIAVPASIFEPEVVTQAVLHEEEKPEPVLVEEPSLVADEEELTVEAPEQPGKPELVTSSVAPSHSEPAPSAASTGGSDPYSDLVLDLENSLPKDFGQPAYAASANPLPASVPLSIPMTPAPQVAASVAPMNSVGTVVAEPPVVIAPSVMTPAAVVEAPAVVAPQHNTSLSDLFAEFKEEVEESSEEKEDPETHYNLGVAFKEMGLLDEAIGELQKVCKAIDHGVKFPHVMQAYTWLAHCFVEKGVPEASVKWYEKALGIPSQEESKTALHYDLACAYEASGERQLALKHFTEVYGTNIDYRDVADRIKALKS